mmetsp:Transcript_982/g.1435  ORF Transcript_982/g.1435 Transcript_982/m.1435 type:complete len:549 (+) Transcript_982:1353-2999(+)
MSERPSTKVKRNACQGCYVSRVKCEYPRPDSDTCIRCARQKRECIPRVVVRGKAAKVAKPKGTFLPGSSHFHPINQNHSNNGQDASARPQPMPQQAPSHYPQPQPMQPRPQPMQPQPQISQQHQQQQPQQINLQQQQQQQQNQQQQNQSQPQLQQQILPQMYHDQSQPQQLQPYGMSGAAGATLNGNDTTNQGGGSTPASPDYMSGLDLDAYRSVSIFDDLPHLGQHYAATASIVRAYRKLGLNKPPTSIRWIVNLLYLLAITEKSMGLLHTSATLAVATGIEIDVEQLNHKRTPLSPKQKKLVEDYVHSTFLVDDPSQAYFIIRLDAGDRGIVANETYEFYFESAGDMVGRLSRSPHFRLWRDFVEDQSVCDNFTAEIVKSFLVAGEPVGSPPQINWTVQDDKPTRLKDKEGNSYTGVLFEYGSMSGSGFFDFLVFGFQQITPVDEGARRRFDQLRAAGINRSAATPGPPPKMQRFDSLFSEMLPPAMDAEVAPAPSSDGSEIDKTGKKSWDDVLPRMDSKELLEALDLVIDSVGGRDAIEGGDWIH